MGFVLRDSLRRRAIFGHNTDTVNILLASTIFTPPAPSLSAMVCLVILFSPKVYIILLHPEKNIRAGLSTAAKYKKPLAHTNGQATVTGGLALHLTTSCFYWLLAHISTGYWHLLLLTFGTYFYWLWTPTSTGSWHALLLAIGTYFYRLLSPTPTGYWNLIILAIGTYFYQLLTPTSAGYWHLLILDIGTNFYWLLPPTSTGYWHLILLAIGTVRNLPSPQCQPNQTHCTAGECLLT